MYIFIELKLIKIKKIDELKKIINENNHLIQ